MANSPRFRYFIANTASTIILRKFRDKITEHRVLEYSYWWPYLICIYFLVFAISIQVKMDAFNLYFVNFQFLRNYSDFAFFFDLSLGCKKPR
jgi:hypothetical protein